VSSVVRPRPGFELDWLAVDVGGHVGLFSTGGQGPVPSAVADHLDIVQAAIERLMALPILGECAESPPGDGNFSFWVEPARRGLYGFDWGPVPVGPYARITVPSQPVLIANLLVTAIRDAAALVRIPVDFSATSHVEASELGVDPHK